MFKRGVEYVVKKKVSNSRENKMSKKYFFFDIDGTLTDRSTGEVVPSALEAIHKLQEAGHFISLATGRAAYKAEKFRAKYDFPNMVCNGGHGIYKACEEHGWF